MKLSYIIDPKYDTQLILPMVQATAPDQQEGTTARMGIDRRLIKSFLNKKIGLSEITSHVQKISDRRYALLSPYLEQTRKWYQQSWDEINNEFFDAVATTTNYNWKHPRYECVVSLFHPGISNWGGNKIVRTWAENPYRQRRITAHELLISHYFTIVEDDFPQERLTDRQIWQLAEIAAFALTGLEEKLTRFWPWDKSGYYTNHNYPQLVKLQLKLKEPFLQRKNFRQYVQTGIKEIKAGGG